MSNKTNDKIVLFVVKMLNPLKGIIKTLDGRIANHYPYCIKKQYP
ncbi:hypothetical protein W04_2723 [Pseudoalteromonas sp. SW0106-04]|nr:hypothetical protein W04_2723 [Pseudoalteromonas sp. SW0106-04]